MSVVGPKVETLRIRQEGGVRFAEISAPPMNLLGPGLIRDLATFLQAAEADAVDDLRRDSALFLEGVRSRKR